MKTIKALYGHTTGERIYVENDPKEWGASDLAFREKMDRLLGKEFEIVRLFTVDNAEVDHKQKIKEKEENIKEMELKIEMLERDVNRHLLRIEELKDHAQADIEKQRFNRIGELKAYQMHLRIMKGQGTHRRKEFFANEAIENLEDVVDRIRSESTRFDSDLPF